MSSKEAGRLPYLPLFLPLAIMTAHPQGRNVSEGLGAKRRVVRAGCRLRMQLRGKLMRRIHPLMNLLESIKSVFNPVKNHLLGGRTGEFFISARRSHREIFSQ